MLACAETYSTWLTANNALAHYRGSTEKLQSQGRAQGMRSIPADKQRERRVRCPKGIEYSANLKSFDEKNIKEILRGHSVVPVYCYNTDVSNVQQRKGVGETV